MSIRTRLGRAVLLVQDYDAALTFYQQNFFCHKVAGDNPPEGILIGFPDDSDTAIWLLKGKKAGQEPAVVIYTSSIEDLYTHLQENGVQLTSPLVIDRAYSCFQCNDPDGNQIIVAELPGTTS